MPALAVASCATVDPDQARICRIALVALEPPGSRIVAIRPMAEDGGVSLTYRTTRPDGAESPHATTCRFAPGRREDLVGLVRDGSEVAGATVYLLNHYFIDTPEGRAADPGAGP